jgi:MFS family permease
MSARRRRGRPGGARPGTRLDFTACALANLLNGAMFGSWFPYVATVADSLKLSGLRLSYALLGLAVGLVIGAGSTTWLMRWVGPRPVLGVGLVIYTAGMALPGLARGWLTLAGALVVAATGNGFVDPSTNSLINGIEAATGRLLQPKLQAFLTAGGLTASIAAPIALRHHVSAHVYLGAVATLGVLLSLVVCVLLALGASAGRGQQRASAAPAAAMPMVRPLWFVVICLIALSGFIAEGVFGDWHGVFLTHETGAKLSAAALGYTVFAFSEFISRWLTDHLARRIGEHRVVLLSGALALLGAIAFVTAHSLQQGLVGAALIGAGVGPIVPLAFSAVEENASAIVGVTLVGYLGLTAGPPLIGFLIHAKGYRIALGALIVLAAVATLLSPALRPKLPVDKLSWGYGRTPLGRALVRLRVIADAAAQAGQAAARAADVRHPKVVGFTVEGGRVEVVPQAASALRRRRRLPGMLAYCELPGHLVALELVRLGPGPTRIVVWEAGRRGAHRRSRHTRVRLVSTSTAQMFERIEDAVARFLEALEVDWRETWTDRVAPELAAQPARLAELAETQRRRPVLLPFREIDAAHRPVIHGPDAAALQRGRARRATALALPVADGGLIVVQWVSLSRRAPAGPALFDSSEAGLEVRPFGADLGDRLAARLSRWEQPPWLGTHPVRRNRRFSS